MKILVTGGSGMVGRNLQEIMPDAVYVSSKEYNLTYQADPWRMLGEHKPDIVIHLAGVVSGITYNMRRPAKHYDDNVLMNTMMLVACRKRGVNRFITTLSTCAYPDLLPAGSYPMTEDQMHAGPPAPSNFSYGYAKRMMAVQIDAYMQEFSKWTSPDKTRDMKYSYLIPCNIYGKYEKTELHKSHFMGALIRKIHEAKLKNEDHIKLMGNGCALRQFLYAGDMARVIKRCILDEKYQNMNVAPESFGLDINRIAEIALKACDAEHLKIEYDRTKPNGQMLKDVSNEKLMKAFPDFEFTDLETGIRETYNYYVENFK